MKADVMPAVNYHRVRAIKGVNGELGRYDRSSNDDDALMGACYALTFQHARTGDGVVGLWITIRTLATVNCEVWAKNHHSRFGRATHPDATMKYMSDKLQGFPLVRPHILEEGMASLQALDMLCVGELERKLYKSILETFEALGRSSLEGMRNGLVLNAD